MMLRPKLTMIAYALQYSLHLIKINKLSLIRNQLFSDYRQHKMCSRDFKIWPCSICSSIIMISVCFLIGLSLWRVPMATKYSPTITFKKEFSNAFQA